MFFQWRKSTFYTQRGGIFLTEEHGHGLVQPPTKERDQRHPEKQELDAHVNRASLREKVWLLRRCEELSQTGTDEEHDGDGAVGGEGHNGEENNTEPPVIRCKKKLRVSTLAKI